MSRHSSHRLIEQVTDQFACCNTPGLSCMLFHAQGEPQIGSWCIRNQIKQKRDPWPQTDWGVLLYSHGYYYFSFISCQELLECLLDWPISPSPWTCETGGHAIIIPTLQAWSTEITKNPMIEDVRATTDSGPSGSLLTITCSLLSLFHSTLSSWDEDPWIFHFFLFT